MMRLNLRLRKVLAMVAVSAVAVTTVPATVFAADYDTHWAKEMIEKWSGKEVLKGYEDGTFRPNGTVTRGELAAMLVRVFGLTDTSSATTYTDVEATKWYSTSVAKVSSAGIMNDYTDGTFKPEEPATREEAAYAIAKAYQVVTKDATSNFTDQAKISDWAEAEIAALVSGGYLNGNPDGSFRPQATLTRAEAVTMVHKITADLVNVAGVYSQDTEGNLVVNTTGVELKDMTITGNLYLAEGIGEGEVKLNNVTVLGEIIVEGGSVNTIKVEGQSKVNNIIVDKAGKNPVRVLFGNLVEVKGTITLKSNATIEGNVLALTKLVVDGAKEVQLVGGIKIEEMVINQTTELALVDGVTIQTLTINEKAEGTLLRGRGTQGNIRFMNVNANGIEVKKGFKYNRDNIQVADKVTIPPKFPESGGGGGGGGGNSGGGAVTEKPVTIESFIVNVNGTDKEIKNTNDTFNVVVDTKANTVTVNGTEFKGTDEITSISAKEANGLTAVKVFATDKLAQKVEIGKAHTVKDLVDMVNAKQADLFDILASVEGQLGKDYYDRAVALLTTAIGDLNDYVATNDAVSVNYMIGRAERVRAKLAQDNADELYAKVQGALSTYGVELFGLGTQTPSLAARVFVTGVESGYEVDTFRVNLDLK